MNPTPTNSFRPLLGLVLCCVVLALAACSSSTASESTEATQAEGEVEVLAEVGEEEITRGEVEELIASQLLSLDRQRHQLMEQALEQAIEQQILELEAAEVDLSEEELMATQVESQVEEVTDAEVDAFYEARKSQIRQPKEEVADQIREYMRSQRQQSVYAGLMADWKKEREIVRYLDPLRFDVAPGDSPAKGPEDAAVTIVEFSDFECPYCRRLNPTLEQLRKNFPEEVRIHFRQFPLPNHSNAFKAAEASLCARDQGKFWEMHDIMFVKQSALGVEQLKEHAAEIGLDAEAFSECLESGRHSAEVSADLAAGQEVGVTGTPAMFINGRFLSGAVPYEQVATVVEDELQRAEGEGGEAGGS